MGVLLAPLAISFGIVRPCQRSSPVPKAMGIHSWPSLSRRDKLWAQQGLSDGSAHALHTKGDRKKSKHNQSARHCKAKKHPGNHIKLNLILKLKQDI